MPLSRENRTRFVQALRACAAQRWPGCTRGWLLRELSQRCGCSRSAIANMLGGRANPSHPMLHRLAGALDVPPALLVPEDVQWQLHGNPRPCAPCDQAAPAPPQLPDTEANRMDAALTHRRLAGRLARALAVAEQTIDLLAGGRARSATASWGAELLDVDAALREAGVETESLADAARALEVAH